MLAEVPADRVRPCVETPLSEGAAQLADQLCHRVGGLGRRRVGTPRAGLERRVALDAPAGHQTGHPRPRHPVLASGVRVGSPLHNNSHNHQTSLRHGPTLKAPGRFLCPEPAHRLPDSGAFANVRREASPIIRDRVISEPFWTFGDISRFSCISRYLICRGARPLYECRCDDCREANSLRNRLRREAKKLVPFEDVPHGTLDAYMNYGCRCDECSARLREYSRARRAAKKEATRTHLH